MSRFADESEPQDLTGHVRPKYAADEPYDEEAAYGNDPVYEDDAAYEDGGTYEDEASEAEAEPMPRKKRRRGSWFKSVLAVLLSLGVLVGGGYFVYTKARGAWQNFTTVADYEGPGEMDVLVEIPEGATLTDMAEILVAHDVVASTRAFLKAANANSGASGIQPGTYQLRTKMRAEDAIRTMLDRTNMVINQVTIPEGLRNTHVVERISEQTGIPVEDLNAALADTGGLGLPAWANGATEGLLFPETYAYDADPTGQEIFSQMVAHFVQRTDSIDFVAKAEALGVSPYDALTIASIIEKETKDPVYGPDMAQVLYNRLRQGMRLQLDSTVIYAVDSPGTIITTDEERANPSPYNTYMHDGLPPGAISNPGIDALEAAVNPTSGDLLYWVAVNPDTGETKFASDQEGHDRNSAEFQAWCRANADRCS